MSIIAPAGTGQSPDTVTRTSPLAVAPAGTAQIPDTITRTSPIAPAGVVQTPQTVTSSPPLAPAASPTALTAIDTRTNPQPINQSGTSGTLVNTSA
jgi:hypothetical protein